MRLSTNYSARLLEETPERTAQFIWGLINVPGAFAAMVPLGFDASELDFGRKLLSEVLAILPKAIPENETVKRAREALAKVDGWDEPTYARTRAIALRSYPEVVDYIFADGLKASKGLDAVNGAVQYNARLRALATGSDPARKATVDKDRQFVDLLEKRGLTAASRLEIDKAIELIRSPKLEAALQPVDEEERRSKLIALRGWYDEWATGARSVINKRAHLIRLGLLKRHSREPEVVDTAPTSPTDAPDPTPSDTP